MFTHNAVNWILASILAIACIGVGAMIRDHFKLRKRKGCSRVEFCARFQQELIPEILLVAVYDHYTSFAMGDSVGITPDDSFEWLRMGQDDVDDDLQRLLGKLGLELPSSATLANWPHPVETIKDVVHWLNWVRQQKSE